MKGLWVQESVQGNGPADGHARSEAVERVIRIRQLLDGPYERKKTRLAHDLRVDPKTLNKVLRGELVTDTTSSKIDARLSRFSAWAEDARARHIPEAQPASQTSSQASLTPTSV